MSAPRATVRLQFHEGFPITDAIDLVEYFHKLGISDIYASPLTRARAGSTHGYDTIDYHVISPELGGEAALRKLVARLREFGMGLILDIVPNHMGVSPDNAWWWSVLREGPNSRYAEYFDIDWNSPDPSLKGKLLAPYLGDPYGKVLSEGQLKIERDQKTHEPIVTYYDARFPISPEHHEDVLRLMDETPHAFDASRTDGRQRLHDLLERQHYRLAWWRTAAEEINWRRFFEISDLAGMRAERDAVRDDIHSLFFRLYEEGLVDGLRVDHVDGLADPKAYCRYLRAELEKRADRRPADAPKRKPYVVVEKILAAGEPLATSWQTDGTTGYDFMSEVGQWLHDPQGEATLTTMWQSISGSTKTFTELSRTARRQLIQQNFAGEFDALVRLLHRIAHFDLMTRDWSPSAIRRVLTELLVYFPVYRTYADVQGHTELDQVPFTKAREGAHASLRPADYDLLDTMAGWLGGEAPRTIRRISAPCGCRPFAASSS
ncbi:malto-oligosyltrehalose synthase [Pigmentiphaga litoralis]|uniref:malto-oligosyltrehalose synthase n=1 Tax=Pigmentiphaga litoralis TaxID=516702 RepID=UPI003B4352CD